MASAQCRRQMKTTWLRAWHCRCLLLLFGVSFINEAKADQSGSFYTLLEQKLCEADSLDFVSYMSTDAQMELEELYYCLLEGSLVRLFQRSGLGGTPDPANRDRTVETSAEVARRLCQKISDLLVLPVSVDNVTWHLEDAGNAFLRLRGLFDLGGWKFSGEMTVPVVARQEDGDDERSGIKLGVPEMWRPTLESLRRDCELALEFHR